MATNYLFNKGYHDIGYIGENDRRITGFRQANIEHGLTLQKLSLNIAYDMPSGYSTIKHMHLSGKKLPRALVCGSDEVAIGVMCYLNERKINIPKDIAIISVDNIEGAEYTTPPLTSVNIQKKQMGMLAVRVLIGNDCNQNANAISLALPATIIERQSC